MKCPICRKRIKNISEEYVENILLERYAECKDDEKLHYYSYHYHDGSTEEVMNNIIFHSHYTDDDRSRVLQAKQYNAVLDLERKFYKEYENRANIEDTLEKVVQYIRRWFNK